ncbi:hypothetical protein K3495_g7693 [Podosphaera aphanis]|nr:hypothetical protein K3495_g7693 [Podosphaera aphanis]
MGEMLLFDTKSCSSKFEPDPEVENHIKDLREARRGLDAALKRHEELMKNKSGSLAGASFMANEFAATKTVEVHPLENSYIAVTGADSHIINSSYSYIAARKALPVRVATQGVGLRVLG